MSATTTTDAIDGLGPRCLAGASGVEWPRAGAREAVNAAPGRRQDRRARQLAAELDCGGQARRLPELNHALATYRLKQERDAQSDPALLDAMSLGVIRLRECLEGLWPERDLGLPALADGPRP